ELADLLRVERVETTLGLGSTATARRVRSLGSNEAAVVRHAEHLVTASTVARARAEVPGDAELFPRRSARVRLGRRRRLRARARNQRCTGCRERSTETHREGT